MHDPLAAGIRPFTRFVAVVGAASAALATIMGAVGSHWVAAHATPRVAASFQTGTAFALWHGLALLLLAAASHADPSSRLLRGAAACVTVGIVLFAGSLWLRGLGVDARVAALAPLGGSSLILGWLLGLAWIISLPARR